MLFTDDQRFSFLHRLPISTAPVFDDRVNIALIASTDNEGGRVQLDPGL
jgi:hypothetical protein